MKGNLIGSKANSQQAPVHWLREITKAKLSSAKPFLLITSFHKTMKIGEKVNLGKFGQVRAILGKLGQVLAS